jgi:hypothetical protein
VKITHEKGRDCLKEYVILVYRKEDGVMKTNSFNQSRTGSHKIKIFALT